MIYIETGSTDVYYNFGLENYFTVEKRLPDTVFLFWRTTPTLMVGKYQNVLEEINKPYADAHGIHLVRRMSGGGTIYTDLGGWQFSFIQHKEAGEIEFGQYIAPVIGALGEMGVRAAFNGRNDLTIDGRKFSGNAQYRLGDCIVHHGSLLFDTDIRQMAEATTPDSYKITSKSIKSVRDRVTNISDHLPVPMDPETFKETMVRHIMNGSTAVYTVTPEDDARIREIARERFQSWEQIFGKSPKFTIDRVGRFRGGKMQFRLDVQKGVIRSAAVYGDFFSTLDAETIGGALTGCPYERGAVLAALRAHGIDGAVYRISAQEMAAAAVDCTAGAGWPVFAPPASVRSQETDEMREWPYGETTGVYPAGGGPVCAGHRNGILVERGLCPQPEAEEHPGAAWGVPGGAPGRPGAGNFQQIHAGKRPGPQRLCPGEICPRFGEVRPGGERVSGREGV